MNSQKLYDKVYKIKPLEWKHEEAGRFSYENYYAVCEITDYTVIVKKDGVVTTLMDGIERRCGSVDEGKALCESHYVSQLEKMLIPVNQ